MTTMEIEEALEEAHAWLRSQSWCSNDQDAIVSITRTDGTWVVEHTSRRWLQTGDTLDQPIGGYGPIVVANDDRITGGEGCTVELTHENIERTVTKLLSKPRSQRNTADD